MLEEGRRDGDIRAGGECRVDGRVLVGSGLAGDAVVVERHEIHVLVQQGQDGIETERCQSSAVALEDSEVWEIPFTRMEALCRQDPAMQRMFHRLMSREIQRDYLMMLLLGSMSAEERLAAFLLNLSQRLTARGYSPVRFVLRMSRREIGSYLGLTLETVSRVFSRFQREGIIRAELKTMELKDLGRLRALVGASVPRAVA